MILYDSISDEDRAEVEKRLKALEKPRKRPTTIGFNHPSTYGVTFTYLAGLGYAERQERIYEIVMNRERPR